MRLSSAVLRKLLGGLRDSPRVSLKKPCLRIGPRPYTCSRTLPGSSLPNHHHHHHHHRAMATSCGSSGKWTGGQTQEEFMLKDTCILVNEVDEVTGHASKKECHIFDSGRPKGLLHRAFSVFLFNAKNELLLQQRASSKITFPSVWTNTCCSHPLHGYDPTEVEDLKDAEAGRTPATINAAIRKLDHELGIRATQVPAEK